MTRGDISLARRYARAYDGAAKDAAQARANLQAYNTAAAALAEVAVYIKNPALPVSVKAEILDKIFAGKTAAAGAAPPAENFLKVIVANKRFYLTDLIGREIQNCLDARLGVKRAQIQTAAPPRKDAALEAALSKLFNAQIAADYKHEPALLAGVKIRAGDILIDGSAAGRVERLAQTLTGK